jgi:hypothetical protein
MSWVPSSSITNKIHFEISKLFSYIINISMEETAAVGAARNNMDDCDAEIIAATMVSDAEMCFHSVVAKLPRTAPIKGAFTSQIETQSLNKVDMMDSLQQMRNTSRFRFLSCEYAGVDADFAMEFEEYLEVLKVWANNPQAQSKKDVESDLLDKFTAFLVIYPNVSIFHSDLMAWTQESMAQRSLLPPGTSGDHISGSSNSSSSRGSLVNIGSSIENNECDLKLCCSFTDADIQLLSSLGYLRKRRDTSAADVYWFSHPQVAHRQSFSGVFYISSYCVPAGTACKPGSGGKEKYISYSSVEAV